METVSLDSFKQGWVDYGQRFTTTALPFLSLYKPLSLPLTLATGGLRSVTSLVELYANIQKGEKIPGSLMQTAASIAAVAGTAFKHPLGLLISACNDLVVEIGRLKDHLGKGDYEKAFVSSANVVNQALYLALIFKGGLELSIASLAIQIFLGAYHARDEIKQGHYIEAAGHAGLALLRGHQITGEVKTLRAKWAFEKWLSQLYKGEIITGKLDPIKYAPPENGCRIFLIRHAETEWNSAGQSQGWNDVPLNEEGLKQAALLGDYFSDLSIEQVYASVLSRAVQTSEAIARPHPNAQITLDATLRFYDPTKKVQIDNETVDEMEARVTQEIIQAATAYLRDICLKAQGQNIVIITHGKVIKSLLYALSGETMDISKIKIANTGMVRVVGTGDQLTLEL